MIQLQKGPDLCQTMHNIGLNTSVQSWSKPFVWTFTSVFFFAHLFCFFIGILVAPQLFSSSSIVGNVCQPEHLTLLTEHGQKDIEYHECIPLGRVAVPPIPLEQTVISFRFPEPSNEVRPINRIYSFHNSILSMDTLFVYELHWN